MQGRAGFMIAVALVGVALGPAYAQEKGAAKKASGTPKAKAESKKDGEEGKKAGAAVNADTEPEFKGAKGKESFKKAKELFDVEEYREAKAEMAKARSEAKSADDRAIVELWVKACDGGTGLASYRKMAEKGMLRRPFLMAMDLAQLYKASPIYPRFTAFTDELRPKVVEVLDDFDVASERFSKKFGKEFESDPTIVFRGTNCLKWTSTREGKVSQIQMKTIPKKWNTEYHSVVFWIRVEGYPVELKLMARSPGDATAGQESPVMEFDHTPQARAGWQRVEAELSQFKKHGTGTLANVEKFIFQIESRSTFKLYIDDVFLTRKDAGEQKGGGEPEAKDEKDTKKKKGKTTPTGKAKQTVRKQS